MVGCVIEQRLVALLASLANSRRLSAPLLTISQITEGLTDAARAARTSDHAMRNRSAIRAT